MPELPGLVKGLGVTLRTMLKPAVTVQYPHEKETPAPRARGVIALKEDNCTVCHEAGDASGGLDLSSYAAAIQGGGSGRTIKPFDPMGSRLHALVSHREKPTMAQVVRWLASQDGNEPDGGKNPGATPVSKEGFSEVRETLKKLEADNKDKNRALAIQAHHAREQFDGFFKLDQRTRSDIYSTSQTLVQPWEDPNISFASSAGAGSVVDLSMVLQGRNTLYVSTPLKDAARYSVVFGGLLGALLRDQAYDIANRYRRPLPDLLCVIDEAGNTPLRWLPEVASTCSGIGVQLVTAWQSKAQIDATYQAQAGPMLTNHATKVFFAGASDPETLRYVTYLGGEEEVHQRSANADAHFGGHRRGVGDSTIHRPLLPPEVLRQAEPGNAILFHGSLPPAHIHGRYVGTDERLRTLSTGQAEELEETSIDSALAAALDFDPTPPVEVLDHLDAVSKVEDPERGPEALEGEEQEHGLLCDEGQGRRLGSR